MMVSDHEIVQAVFDLKRAYPQLCVDALCYDGPPPYRSDPAEIAADVLKNKDQIQPCVDWLARRKRVKTFVRTHDTYTYKHVVESEIGRWVSHMSMLVAVQLTGVIMEPSVDRPWAGSLKVSAAGVA